MKKILLSLFFIVSAMAANAQLIAPDTEKYPDHVDSLLKSDWSQGAPFDNMTPTYTTTNRWTGTTVTRHCPVGCVATALAQIMYYWKYPEVGQGEIKRKTFLDRDSVNANFGATHYDWANMLDHYDNRTTGYTTEQIDAVATLSYHAGVAVGMMYQQTGSSAMPSGSLATSMVNYFRYSKDSIKYVMRSDYTKNEWMEMIYHELSQGRPVFYTGKSQNAQLGVHAFVLDGYDSEGKVHINWGWRGLDDGYYDIDLTGATGHDYTDNQAMIIGLMPLKTTTGITNIHNSTSGNDIMGIYTVEGKRVNKPGKGLHIIIYSDGTAKKVLY